MGAKTRNQLDQVAAKGFFDHIEKNIEVGNSNPVRSKTLNQYTEKVAFEINWENIRHYRVVVGQFEKSLAFRTIKVFPIFMFNILIILLDI